jgi:hypothetical protein
VKLEVLVEKWKLDTLEYLEPQQACKVTLHVISIVLENLTRGRPREQTPSDRLDACNADNGMRKMK